MNTLPTLGIVSCLGGPYRFCGHAAKLLQQSPWPKKTQLAGLQLQWHMLYPKAHGPLDSRIYQLNKEISRYTRHWTEFHQPFLVIGGDHSCALGTWAGVLEGQKKSQNFGLLWLDAHMDAHTFATSPSKNIHGMPVAGLLGKADTRLASLYPSLRHIPPENLILLGIRSYEREEYAFLKSVGVKIVYAECLRQQNDFAEALTSALNQLAHRCTTVGISIDLDLVTPEDAPGVETPAPAGIKAEQLLMALQHISRQSQVCGLEISEFNPEKDQHNKTLKLVQNIITAFYGSGLRTGALSH